MALLQVSSGSNFLNAAKRITATVNHMLMETQHTQLTILCPKHINSLHVTSIRRYPDAPMLPLPTNVSEIFASETGRFTPERARDIAAPVLLYGRDDTVTTFGNSGKKAFDKSSLPTNVDSHVDSYDCFGAVSLNGTMQSNVPKPFCSRGKSNYLNMPGGQWARDDKYIAEDMQKSHYRSSIKQQTLKVTGLSCNTVLSTILSQTLHQQRHYSRMRYSTNVKGSTMQFLKNMYNVDKLKKAIKELGITVFVVHIIVSLTFLGGCYTAVISGINVKPIIRYFKNEEDGKALIMEASTNFVLAYTIHKLLLPVRLFLTLSIAPIVVRYLRRAGILKGHIPIKNKTN